MRDFGTKILGVQWVIMTVKNAPYCMMTKHQAKRLRGGSQPVRLKMRRSKGEPATAAGGVSASATEIQGMLTLPTIEEEASQTDEELYQDLVQNVIDRIGHGGTTSRDELDRVGTELLGGRYARTYAASEEVHLSRRKPYAVLNTSDSPGEHWCGVVLTANDGHVVYDSFGRAELGGCHRRRRAACGRDELRAEVSRVVGTRRQTRCKSC